jgi:hypothetical protein
MKRVEGPFSKWYVFAALAIVVPVVAVASPTSVPNTFGSGTVISSSKMNDNFSAVVTGINAIDTRVSTLEAKVAALEAKKSLPSSEGVFAYVGTAVSDGPIARTFNSTGGTNSLTGTNGSYTVMLGGITCPGNGIAVAQAAGASGISCRVNGDWSTPAAGGGCQLFVGCFNVSGNLVATPFSLIYAR